MKTSKIVGLESIQGYLQEYDGSKIFHGSEALEVKGMQVRNMTNFAMEMAEEDASIDKKLLEIACLHHDDGRALQFELLGNFNDRIASHNALGLDGFDRWMAANHVEITPEIQVIRYVMYYHGRQHMLSEEISEEYQKYVQIASDADDIENGCVGAVSYLLRECNEDAKGYNQMHPEHIGQIKPYLWEYFEKGEWFDKLVHCQSYAEYVLFAATLAKKSLKRYGKIAKKAMEMPAYGYVSAYQGYSHIFSEVMNPEDAKRATKILKE